MLMCMLFLYVVQSLFFSSLAHLSGRQKCLLSVGGSAKEFTLRKKNTPTSQAGLALRLLCCLLAHVLDEKVQFVVQYSKTTSIDL